MFAYCKECLYDSGDYPTLKELAEKVMADGGRIVETVWYCPKCRKELQID